MSENQGVYENSHNWALLSDNREQEVLRGVSVLSKTAKLQQHKQPLPYLNYRAKCLTRHYRPKYKSYVTVATRLCVKNFPIKTRYYTSILLTTGPTKF